MLTKRGAIRVASVLPSATEILCLIGGEEFLVARSHEDNYPSNITNRPVVTGQVTSTSWTSASAVDKEVSEALRNGNSLYTLDSDTLRALHPDIILTQDICSVCAIDLETVNRLADTMNPKPQILSLNPKCLIDVLEDITVVGKAVGLEKQADLKRHELEQRIKTGLNYVNVSKQRPRKKIAFIEWSDPIYVGGHWTAQIIHMAGA